MPTAASVAPNTPILFCLISTWKPRAVGDRAEPPCSLSRARLGTQARPPIPTWDPTSESAVASSVLHTVSSSAFSGHLHDGQPVHLTTSNQFTSTPSNPCSCFPSAVRRRFPRAHVSTKYMVPRSRVRVVLRADAYVLAYLPPAHRCRGRADGREPRAARAASPHGQLAWPSPALAPLAGGWTQESECQLRGLSPPSCAGMLACSESRIVNFHRTSDAERVLGAHCARGQPAATR
ncbi:hypothetical protein MSAN_01151300 [Mycena sanguinolenta]|uniref:Uncharacterized protein n=1 Tax=Mycena sanguinolenta TaxID=230812 RepID=A0A8H6YJV5_9AGAR|nr:hypothetical protein MSAN_01151300 [Mycena sanguinolenta]